MTAQAQVSVPGNQHLVRDRTMHLMASCASVAQCLVFPRKWTALVFMAFKTNFIRVVHARRRPGPRIHAVEVMAIGATHLPLQDRMAVRKPELHFLVHMAGETNFRFFS